ncbi:Sphingoid long-chain base transporter RSB1 [Sparassis crispa]|uniref:Sphingoid long-chain base transporter RSB1 n=1 Tax=Sparassis crispa TaxID=139825 RepID=A0A401G736_9APHY|nr:Sphingoid long-chain base transporter RSB1 [Sparassis crispa]GBE77975.1 Sphingoid long-chain base transporter RSB1 [Sparassis crispa]
MYANHTSDPATKEFPYYHYLPTRSVCILFVVLYSISTVCHLVQAFVPRRVGWWVFPTICLGGAGEILGWSGRLWSNLNIQKQTPFFIQIVMTIIAPTPVVAGIFIIFGMITERLGASYSRLAPKNYSRIFLSCDIISLVVQAAGGALATSNTTSTSEMGGHIMLAGIAFQLAVITVFVLCVAEYLFRFLHGLPVRTSGVSQPMKPSAFWDMRMKLMVGGMLFSTTFLYIRAIYRTIELSSGYGGPIQTNQLYFDILDGAMVTLSLYTLNFFHPGVLLRLGEVDSTIALGNMEQFS